MKWHFWPFGSILQNEKYFCIHFAKNSYEHRLFCCRICPISWSSRRTLITWWSISCKCTQNFQYSILGLHENTWLLGPYYILANIYCFISQYIYKPEYRSLRAVNLKLLTFPLCFKFWQVRILDKKIRVKLIIKLLYKLEKHQR